MKALRMREARWLIHIEKVKRREYIRDIIGEG